MDRQTDRHRQTETERGGLHIVLPLCDDTIIIMFTIINAPAGFTVTFSGHSSDSVAKCQQGLP